MPWIFLPSGEPSNEVTVQPILAAEADAYVLAALPPSASSLVYALAAVGALQDPGRGFTSRPPCTPPPCSRPSPRACWRGRAGWPPARSAGVDAFRARFSGRWQDPPLDDATPSTTPAR